MTKRVQEHGVCQRCNGQGWYHIVDPEVPPSCYENCPDCGGINECETDANSRKGTGRCPGGEVVERNDEAEPGYVITVLYCATCGQPVSESDIVEVE